METLDHLESIPLTADRRELHSPPGHNDVMKNTGTAVELDTPPPQIPQEDSVYTKVCNSPVKAPSPLIYKISDNPPLHLTVIFAFQHALMAFSNQLALSLLVAQAVCGEHDPILRTQLLGSTMFMNGLATFLMCLIGVRLPMLQGGAYEYILPLVALRETEPGRCTPRVITETTVAFNSSNHLDLINPLVISNYSMGQSLSKETTTMMSVTAQHVNQDVIYHNIQAMMGSLMLTGLFHFLIGVTGLVGVLLRYIGPVTVVPAILLVALYIFKTVTKLTSVHWGTGLMTCVVSIVLSLYLGNWKMPLPYWTRRKGFHVIRSQFHQTTGILIATLFGWAVSAVLTVCGAFSDDPDASDYNARTDVMTSAIHEASWVYFPYPGQFGPPSFSGRALVAFLIATLISILDSICDYYACARTCQVPPPPSHAVNRGIAVEGFCSFLAGTIGCGHATTTYGGNVGAIGLTKVGSRRVFLALGILYMLFGIVGKITAIFVTIPYPVLGGIMITMIGMFTGVVLSNLQFVQLTSTRNLAVIGISLIIGLMVPYWTERHPNGINTGNTNLDQILHILLGNANLAGALTAFILDNTIPGTREERGFAAWEYVTKDEKGKEVDAKEDEPMYIEGLEVYEPLVPRIVKRWSGLRYLPFMPDRFVNVQ